MLGSDQRKRVISPSESLEDLLCFGESSGENSVMESLLDDNCEEKEENVHTQARPIKDLPVLDSTRFTRCEPLRRSLGSASFERDTIRTNTIASETMAFMRKEKSRKTFRSKRLESRDRVIGNGFAMGNLCPTAPEDELEDAGPLSSTINKGHRPNFFADPESMRDGPVMDLPAVHSPERSRVPSRTSIRSSGFPNSIRTELEEAEAEIDSLLTNRGPSRCSRRSSGFGGSGETSPGSFENDSMQRTRSEPISLEGCEGEQESSVHLSLLFNSLKGSMGAVLGAGHEHMLREVEKLERKVTLQKEQMDMLQLNNEALLQQNHRMLRIQREMVAVGGTSMELLAEEKRPRQSECSEISNELTGLLVTARSEVANSSAETEEVPAHAAEEDPSNQTLVGSLWGLWANPKAQINKSVAKVESFRGSLKGDTIQDKVKSIALDATLNIARRVF